MKLTITVLCLLVFVVTIRAPPIETVDRDKPPADAQSNQGADDVIGNLEYGRYLKEVVEILESDPDFRRKIENATVDDIKSGNIAQHLSLVQHHIRTQLDEAKQREMIRLRDLVAQKVRSINEKQRLGLLRGAGRMQQFLPQHIDHKNAETFGEVDLERLIRHASKDLDELDRKREQQFKEYEMRKEYERRMKLVQLDQEERQRLEKLHEEAMEQKKNHPKVNHPGSVNQLEEVWQQVDKLESDQFSPKSFFKLHDINGDGFLDEAEIEAIMLKEAEKIHDGVREGDPVEKQEELSRMRQHVMKEFDKNEDRMLSIDEFLVGINGTGAKNDQGWLSIEDTKVFSDQEFKKFSEKMAPMSTPIPVHQTPSPTPSQQNLVQPQGQEHAPLPGVQVPPVVPPVVPPQGPPPEQQQQAQLQQPQQQQHQVHIPRALPDPADA